MRNILFLLSGALGMLLTAAVPLKADNAPEVFMQAEQALHNDKKERYFTLKSRLRAYPLYNYLRYQEIIKNFDNYDNKLILDYLQDAKGTFWADRLQSRWIEYLGVHQHWQTYLKVYNHQGGLKQQCWYWRARYQQGDKQKALAGFSKIWAYGGKLPDACNPLIQRWRNSQYDTPRLRLRRISLLLEKGDYKLAGYLSLQLPATDKAFVKAWISNLEAPQNLAAFLKNYKDHPYAGKAAEVIMQRFADDNPQGAATLWQDFLDAHSSLITSETRNNINGDIAIELSRVHSREAMTWLQRVADKNAPDLLWQWRMRSAVRWENWALLLQWARALPPGLADEDQWQYWHAVALWHNDQKAAAHKLWAKLAKIRDYYGFLAADQINAPYAVQPHALKVSESLLNQVADTDLVRETRALIAIHKPDLATEYFRWTMAAHYRDKPGQARAVAALTEKWHKPNLTIYALMISGDYRDLNSRFPKAHARLVAEMSERYEMAPAWILAVMRQESHFRVDAGSWAGAKGLMQLMPATASYIAKAFDIPYKSKEDLYQPRINIELGVANLVHERRVFDGNMVLAVAAYNAGGGNVSSWLPAHKTPADRWVVTIPFAETRHYLNNVLAYYIIYQHVKFGNNQVRLADVMGDIPASSDT